MKNGLLLFALIGSLSFPLSSYAQNIPQLGSAADQLWAKSEELDIGKAAYDQLLRQGHILQNQDDNDYLNYLGNKIGVYAKTRLGLRFYLTNSTSINAFASPGGYIGVNAGLVLATENEHELAGVLAHEITHVSQDHIARTVLAAHDRRITNMAAMVAGVLVATTGDAGDAGAGIISAVVAGETQQQLNDIRRHEIEADRIGRDIMQKSGFDEQGMYSFFGKLYAPRSASQAPAYLLTHPLPLARQADINSTKKRQKNLRSSDEYYLFRARLRAKLLNKSQLSELIAAEKSSVTLQQRDAGYYLSALQLMQSGQFDVANAALNRMKSGMKNKRDVRLLRAKLAMVSGKGKEANAIYQKLWQRYSGDSVVAYDYARYLMSRGQHQKAANLLEKQLNATQLNPQLYLLYGQILGKIGETAKQHQVLIRYYQQSGAYEKALAQAQIAEASAQDWQTRSMMRAKMQELQRIIDSLKNN